MCRDQEGKVVGSRTAAYQPRGACAGKPTVRTTVLVAPRGEGTYSCAGVDAASAVSIFSIHLREAG